MCLWRLKKVTIRKIKARIVVIYFSNTFGKNFTCGETAVAVVGSNTPGVPGVDPGVVGCCELLYVLYK